MIEFLLITAAISKGLIMGFLTVGMYTLQTLKVLAGEPIKTILASLGVSTLYWVSINHIVNDDFTWYFGFSIGAALATTTLSIIEKRKTQNPLIEKQKTNK